jgi:hypothetical protein
VACAEDALRYTVRVTDSGGECDPCDHDDTLVFPVEIKNNGSSACTVTRNNGCVADSVEIHVSGPHGGLAATGSPMCTEAIEVDVLDPGESLTGTVMMDGPLGYGNFAAIADFTDHHSGHTSMSFASE